MTTDRRPYGPLELDDHRHEALVRGVLERAAPEIARRSAAGAVSVLLDWTRPAFAVAATLAAIALGVAALDRGAAPVAPAAPPAGVAEALGMTGPVTAWIEADRTPAVDELLVSMEGRSR